MARENLTAGRIATFRCPAGKPQAFLWDKSTAGLAVRATAAGARAFVFQSRLNGAAIRMTIGDPSTWTIPAARAEARRLQSLLDQGKDPRAERNALIAAQAAERDAAKIERQRREVRGLDAWRVYLADRTPHWGARNLADHEAMAQAGGQPRKRAREKVTKPGPLYELLDRPLAMIDAELVAGWIERETKARPTRAALAFRMLNAFVNWCGEHAEYRDIVDASACKARRTREKIARPKARSDALQREQLAAWFDAVRQQPPVPAAYLQALLLTGARREELLGLRWDDVDFRWHSLRIRDKVEGERVIPLPGYVAQLFSFLPRRNGWVFSSTTAKDGRLQEARIAHNRALAVAGLPHVTLHGLRRSFGSLSEWVECPVGVVAQIMGHKPSALAERHYRVRPLDLLRVWHEKIAGWILAEAGLEQLKRDERPAETLRVVA